MAHLIRECEPRRSGRKRHRHLRALRLIRVISFHPIVELQHQRVVRRPRRLRDAQPAQRRGDTRRRKPQLRREAARDDVERLAHAPGSRTPFGIDVREDAQDAAAMDRRRRKRVDVQPRVVLAPRGLAPLDLDRTKARAALRHAAAIRRKKPVCQRRGVPAEARHHACEQLPLVAVEGRAADRLRDRIEADVLGRAGDPSRKELLLAVRHVECELAQKKHIASLQRRGCLALKVGCDLRLPAGMGQRRDGDVIAPARCHRL